MQRIQVVLTVICLSLLLPVSVWANSDPHPNPVPKREFRGAWIATVVNIDWPSKAGLSTAQQQAELIAMLDNHQRAGINAVILQVRPSADALYANSKEPWSRFLTGKPGQAPSPFYDPLEFAITEAHKRGMELHAWINPYRASFDLVDANIARDHITRRKPEWFFNYGGKKLFNPGIPEVRHYINEVIMEIVHHYDVDGIHFDDYFYPYPVGNAAIPDAATFKRYPNGFTNIADWRRNNVNLLIKELSDSIRAGKKHVKFGISPFGIWDNKRDHPEGSQTSGLSGYRTLYADALVWLQEGWIDYVNPQIYFPFGMAAAPYDVLVDWWSKHTYGRHFYIGHAAYRASDNRGGWENRNQIPRQIRYMRDNRNAHGSVFYSGKHISNNVVGLRDTLQYDLYRYKSLPPAMPWLDSIPPSAPFGLQARQLEQDRSTVVLHWQRPEVAEDGDQPYGYVVYRFNEGEEIDLANAQHILHITYDSAELTYVDSMVREGSQYTYVVTAIDRLKNESTPSNIMHVQTAAAD